MKKVKNIFINIYIFIELFCSLCCLLNKHDKEHVLIDINNKESLKSNNISYDKSISDFDKVFKKIKNIKQRIEEGIEEINISQKKIFNEITTSFEDQRNKLNRKEKQLKLELDEKVKQIKEELNKFLNDVNQLILFNERTNKAIENFEKTNNTEEIRALYYISEININNEKTKEFLKIPIRNLDITFNSDLNTLDYKDYYFSGIPVPKNIKTEIQGNVILSWDIDKFKVKDFDNKKIKYEVEIKKDNEIFSNESYEKIMHLDRQKLNNDCEIKIRTIYDDIYGNWSEIQKFNINNSQNYFCSYKTYKVGSIKNNNNPFLNYN